MRDIKNKLTSSKNTKNIKNRRGKSFGYQVLGFGAGGSSSTFIVASGGTETTDGDYKIHTFTSSGDFVVCSAGFPAGCGGDGDYVDYLVVAAGGGSQGGGGGGYRSTNRTYPASTGSAGSGPTSGIQVSATTYPIVVGSPNPCSRGGNSSFGPITSTGGGNGCREPGGGHIANSGGSGGGSGHRGGSGNGNTPPTSPSQGNPGGPPAGSPTTGSPYDGKGGGGMGGTGGAGNGTNGGPGGNGGTSDITGSSVIYAAGGGGTHYTGGSGGNAGGPNSSTSGAGGHNAGPNGNRGLDGRGSGSGKGSPYGGSEVGGTGVVIIRYKIA